MPPEGLNIAFPPKNNERSSSLRGQKGGSGEDACLEQLTGGNKEERMHHPSRNYNKRFLGTISFVIIFVFITKIIPPDNYLCNVAATGVSLFARKQAKELAL